MKKFIALILVLMLLSLCACGGTGDTENTQGSNPAENNQTEGSTPQETECTHEYTESVTKEATCAEEGQKTFTCAACGDSYTEAIEKVEHTYADATCTAPKTCSVCAATEGNVGDHSYQGGNCTGCGAADPSYQALTSGSWVCTKIVDGMLAQQKLAFGPDNDGMGPMWSVRYYEDVGEPDPDFMDDMIAEGSLVQYNGSYYQHMGMGDMGTVKFSEAGSTVTVELEWFDVTITLQRITGNQLQVTAITGSPSASIGSLSVGEIFQWTE